MNLRIDQARILSGASAAAVTLALTAHVFAQPCTLPEGAIAWWAGEGDARDAMCPHHGTLVNGATFAAGMVGQAFDLDGLDDHVVVPDDESLTPPTDAISVEAWINPGDADGGAVITKYNSEINARAWNLLVRDTGALRWAIYNDVTNEFRVVDTADGLIPSGSFSHVAATFDVATQEMRTYLNGEEVPNTFVRNDAVSSLADTEADVRIGAFIDTEGGLTAPFLGLIDEPTVYDRALTPADVKATYEAGSTGKCAPAVNCCPSDINDDGATTFADLLALLGDWGPCP